MWKQLDAPMANGFDDDHLPKAEMNGDYICALISNHWGDY